VIGAAMITQCFAVADLYFRIISKLGEGPYNEAQEQVCDCCVDSGPCGGKTCPEGWGCCGSNGGPGDFSPACYDPAKWVCCGLKEPMVCPISGGTKSGWMYCHQQKSRPWGGNCSFEPEGINDPPVNLCADSSPDSSIQCSGPFPVV
jgi:hypothetical protein